MARNRPTRDFASRTRSPMFAGVWWHSADLDGTRRTAENPPSKLVMRVRFPSPALFDPLHLQGKIPVSTSSTRAFRRLR